MTTTITEQHMNTPVESEKLVNQSPGISEKKAYQRPKILEEGDIKILVDQAVSKIAKAQYEGIQISPLELLFLQNKLVTRVDDSNLSEEELLNIFTTARSIINAANSKFERRTGKPRVISKETKLINLVVSILVMLYLISCVARSNLEPTAKASTPVPTTSTALVEATPTPLSPTAIATPSVPVIPTFTPTPEVTPMVFDSIDLQPGTVEFSFTAALVESQTIFGEIKEGKIDVSDVFSGPVYAIDSNGNQVFAGMQFLPNVAANNPNFGGVDGVIGPPLTVPVSVWGSFTTVAEWLTLFENADTSFFVTGGPNGQPESEPDIPYSVIEYYVTEDGFLGRRALRLKANNSWIPVAEVVVKEPTQEGGSYTAAWEALPGAWSITENEAETKSPLVSLTNPTTETIPIITFRNPIGEQLAPLPKVSSIDEIRSYLDVAYSSEFNGFIDYNRIEMSGANFRALLLQNGCDAEFSAPEITSTYTQFVDMCFVAVGHRKIDLPNFGEVNIVLLSGWGRGENGVPQNFLFEAVMANDYPIKEWQGTLGNIILPRPNLTEIKTQLFGENSTGLMVVTVNTAVVDGGLTGDNARNGLNQALLPTTHPDWGMFTLLNDNQLDLSQSAQQIAISQTLQDITNGISPVNGVDIVAMAIPKENFTH